MKAKNFTKYCLLLITLFLISCGRKREQQEQFFIQELNQMLTWPDNGTYSNDVMNLVFNFISNHPQSLEYKFKEETPHIYIATSDDGNVRAYNLDRHGFEGNPALGFDCKTLLQYRTGEKALCKNIEIFDGFITHIHHIDSNKYYLLEDYQGNIHQGLYEKTTLHVYIIENDKIHQVKKAFVNRNNVSNNLEFSWNDLGGHIELDFNKEDSLVVYSIYNKELYIIKGIPLKDKPLKYCQYCWNGRNFESKKYDEPTEYYNNKFFIRIEQNNDNSWTYKCWNGGKKKGEPNLIIKSGTKQYWSYDYELISFDEWVTDDASSPLGEKYTFSNNGYRYEYSHGWARGSSIDELYVVDSNENVIYCGDFTPVLH